MTPLFKSYIIPPMSENETPEGKFAVVNPIDVHMDSEGNAVLHLEGFGSDYDTLEAQTAVIADQLGADSWVSQRMDSHGAPIKDGSKTFFSGAKWKASNWEPKGPTPPWRNREKADPTEPIN